MSSGVAERSVVDALLSGYSGGDGWLGALQGRGRAAFEKVGVPTTKHEEWKYTSLRSVSEVTWREAPASEATLDDVADALLTGVEQVRIAFVNGRYAPDLTTSLKGDAGVEVRELPCALRDRLPVLERHLGSLAGIDAHPFAALNTALLDGGALVHIAAGAKLSRPIHILHITDTRSEADFAAYPRVLVVAEPDSEGFVIESYASLGDGRALVCPVTELVVGDGARLGHVKLQTENLSSLHIAATAARLGEGTTLESFGVTFGGALTRNDLDVFLAGEHAHCRMDGIVALTGAQHADNHTRLDHAMPNCDSFEVYKHVLDDSSVAVFNGKIFVHQDAQKTDAKQTNQTLLLSRQATIDTKPQLEIFADDVKCTHGATIGQVREDALFYLRSRGVPETEARNLLVYAFAAEVLERIELPALVEVLEAMLYRKLATS